MANLFAGADIVTLHIPASKETIGIVDKHLLNNFKDSGVLLNFAREEIVDEEGLREALESGKVKKFISDFPTPYFGARKCVYASSRSEHMKQRRTVFMVASQITEFLKTGNISNSVNLRSKSTNGSFA